MTHDKLWFLTKKQKEVYETIIEICGDSSYCSWSNRQLKLRIDICHTISVEVIGLSLQELVRRGIIYRIPWGPLRHIIPKIYNRRYLEEFLIPSFGEKYAEKMLFFKNFCIRSIDWPEKKPHPIKSQDKSIKT